MPLPDGLCRVKTLSDSALIGIPVEAFNVLDVSNVLPTPCRSPSCSLPSINPLQEIRRRTQRGRRGDNNNNDNDNNNPQPSNPNNTNEGNTNGKDPWATSFFGGNDEEKKKSNAAAAVAAAAASAAAASGKGYDYHRVW